MYYPYFRGKQNELLAIRHTAQLMASKGFIPTIEPVKASLNGLEKALKAVSSAKGEVIVVVNPSHGDYSGDGSDILSLIEEKFLNNDSVHVGILLNQNVSSDQTFDLYESHKKYKPVLIHAGFAKPQNFSNKLGKDAGKLWHVFFEKHCGSSYRSHFEAKRKILLRNGFEIQNNADYPKQEIFSDLNITFEKEGFDGFGDFLIVGDVYKEGGGPAYAVAIHITFINDDENNVMYVYHFVSDTNGTPTDTAAKFAEALAKLVKNSKLPNTKIFHGDAISEYRQLHKNSHFPGLGTAKKLSMIHHIETLADFFS